MLKVLKAMGSAVLSLFQGRMQSLVGGFSKPKGERTTSSLRMKHGTNTSSKPDFRVNTWTMFRTRRRRNTKETYMTHFVGEKLETPILDFIGSIIGVDVILCDNV